jgi:hypothetical protein
MRQINITPFIPWVIPIAIGTGLFILKAFSLFKLKKMCIKSSPQWRGSERSKISLFKDVYLTTLIFFKIILPELMLNNKLLFKK